VVGPWDAFNVSRISQTNRFVSILNKYNMIENGKIVKSKSEVSVVDKTEITGILNYFSGPHKFSELEYLPKDFDMSKMDSVFGFGQENSGIKSNEKGFGYYNPGTGAVQISGYDVFFKFSAYNNGKLSFEQSIDTKLGALKLVIEGNSLSIQRDGAAIYSYDLNAYIQGLFSKYGGYSKGSNVIAKDLIVIDSNDRVKIMIIFENIDGNIDSEGAQAQINNMSGSVFIGVK
jgi:hypothetical protein